MDVYYMSYMNCGIYLITIIYHNILQAPPKLSRDTGQLVTYLCQNARDDVEKVRAIFAWISSRDRINTAPELGSGFPPNGSPLEHLSMIMSNASTYTYNTLFESLCKLVHITIGISPGVHVYP